MGLLAGVLSLPTGFLLAVILVDVINVRSFGWTMRLAPRPAACSPRPCSRACSPRSWPPSTRCGASQRMPLSAALRQE